MDAAEVGIDDQLPVGPLGVLMSADEKFVGALIHLIVGGAARNS